jgi:hypothetical protein
MAYIPFHYPFLYASQAEWNDLPPECYVEYAKQELIFFNAKTLFQTQQTDATTATQGNQPWLNFSSNVLKYPSIVVKNTGAAGKPVETSDIESIQADDYNLLADSLYGPANVSTMGGVPPAICGTWTDWNRYVAYALATKQSNGTASDSNGLWNVGSAYDQFLAVNNSNTHIYTNRFNFGCTLVTTQKALAISALPGGNVTVRIPMYVDKLMNRGSVNISSAMATCGPVINASSTKSLITSNAVGWLESMWRPNRSHLHPGLSHNANILPRALGFGLEEIVAMNASNDNFEYKEGQLHLKAEREYFTVRSSNKLYTDGVYAYNDDPLLIREDEGQGFLFGRPWYV